MFGWEFPPHSSGGLGTACYGLTKGLNKNNVEVLFVLPHAHKEDAEFVKLISASNIKVKRIRSIIQPYMTSNEYYHTLKKDKLKELLPNLVYLRFNISAGTPKRYAYIHGVPEKYFEETCDIIKECVRIKKEDKLDVTLGLQMY